MNPSSYRLLFSCLLVVAAVSGCAESPVPDHRIKLMTSEDGRTTIAVPPECLSWHDYASRSFENHPWPQYGCATARNLAAQVERPDDLATPKELGGANPVTTASAQSRYLAGKTTPLVDPNANAPSQVIKMEDSRVGGGQQK